MKKITLFIIHVFCATFAFSSIITVSNAGQSAQFNNVTAALTAAQSGDTLYVFGSTVSYGDISIDKSITIIGSGINTNRQAHARTIFNTVIAKDGVSPLTLSGIYITDLNFQGVLSNTVVSDFTVAYCYVKNFITRGACGSKYNNFLINNCILERFELLEAGCSMTTSTIQNLIVKNSLIYSSYGVKNATYYNCNFGNYYSNVYGLPSLQLTQNSVFNNCIFREIDLPLTMSEYSDQTQWTFYYKNSDNSFVNCLTYKRKQNPNSDLNYTEDNNIATGTIINTDPLFVNAFNTIESGVEYFIRWNPQISSSSPAYHAGTDNTDIGVTGGSMPYRYFLEPDIPVIRKLQLQNPVIPANGTLKINVTASKPQ